MRRSHRWGVVGGAAALTLTSVCGGAEATSVGPVAPGATQVVERTPTGAPPSQIGIDAMEFGGDVSGDGRYVVYQSLYPDLVPGDSNYSDDVFLYDTVTQSTTILSRTAAGTAANGSSGHPLISRNGRYVVFRSRATDLAGVEQSTPGVRAYRYDTSTRRLTLIQRPNLGSPVAIDATGSHLIYEGGPANKVYRVDLATNTVDLVSRTPGGGAPNGVSSGAAISGTGRYVVYTSTARNIVPRTPTSPGIYRWDAQTGTTSLLRAPSRTGVTESYVGLQVSDDGNIVSFNGYADSPTDTTLPGSSTAALGYLYRLDVRAGRLQQVDPGFVGAYRIDFDYWTVAAQAFTSSMSADGRYLAFVFRYDDSTGRRHNDVVRYDQVTGRGSVVQADVVFMDYEDGPGNVIQRVEISASGRQVLYVHAPTGSSVLGLEHLWTASP